MSLVDSVRSVLTNYANFSGRARRSEYWWFALALIVVFGLLAGLSRASALFAVVYGLAALAVFVPGSPWPCAVSTTPTSPAGSSCSGSSRSSAASS